MPFPTITAPIKSPSLGEYSDAQYTDPSSGKVLPLLGVVAADPSSGATGLAAGAVTVSDVSQVTARKNKPQAGTAKIPMIALVGLDPTTGAPIAFKPASATAADTALVAASVSGKFQSAVRVATGSSESIAHGLGVAPSLVLVSIYDDTNAGVLASGFVIVEGTHTTTNVLVTVTANAKYKVIAFA